MRRLAAVVLVCLAAGCTSGPSTPAPVAQTSADAVPHTGTGTGTSTGPRPPAPLAAQPAAAAPPPFALQPVTALLPEIRVDTDAPIEPALVHAAMAVPGVTFATAVAIDDVRLRLPDGRSVDLRVAAVDPAGFRMLSPQVNADAPELWQRIVEGHLAVAHEVAEAHDLTLGTVVRAPGGRFGIGAFAANGQPPVADAVVDAAAGARMGLGQPSTLLVSVDAEAWPDEVAAALETALGVEATLIYGKPQRTLDGLPPDATVWDALAACESSGRWDLDSGNGYYGGLQFLPSSWQLVGGTGLPHEASRDEQIHRAELLLLRQGWQAWPVCSARLGLRAGGPPGGQPTG